MCPLLVPASKGKLLLFFSFFVAAAIDSTTVENKAPLSSLYSLDVYGVNSLLTISTQGYKNNLANLTNIEIENVTNIGKHYEKKSLIGQGHGHS